MKSQHTDSNYEIIPVHELTRVRFYTSVDSGSYVPPHWHDAIEIVYLQEGDLTFMIENRTIEMKVGQCILVNPNIIHATRCLSPNRAIVFQIPVSFLAAYLPNVHQVIYSLHDVTPDKQSKLEDLKKMLLDMQMLNDLKPDGGLLRFNSLLFDVIFTLCQSFSTRVFRSRVNHQEHDLSRIVSVLSYTEQHYNVPISIEEIANIAGFQPNYFCRFFKKCMGVTFLEYQNELRLAHIYSDLLRSKSDKSISSILEQHGFTNYKVFRRMFFKRFQATPSEIRERHRDTARDMLLEKVVL